MTFTLWVGLRLYRVVCVTGSHPTIRLEGKGPFIVTNKQVTKDSQIWVDNT